MLFCKYILKDRILKIERINKSFKETNTDIEVEIQKVLSNIYDIRLALEECVFASENSFIYSSLLYNITVINKELISLNNSNGKRLKEILNYILDLYKDFDYQKEDSLTMDYYNLISKNYELLNSTLTPIKKHIEKNNRPLNLLETDCLKGYSFTYLKNNNLSCYGTEETDYISIAKKDAVKVVKGKLKGSRISNNAFDYLIAKCPISCTLKENMSFSIINKCEKEYLMNVNKYLRPGGIILIAIPYFRLYKDIAELIAKNYNNIHVYIAEKDLWETKRFVYIYAQKNYSKSFDNIGYEKIRKAFNPDNLEEFDYNLTLDYILPSKTKEIDLFKGSVLDMEELYYLVDNSDALEEVFEMQHVEKIGESSTKPLLPFNIGQIGLVLTSGCLDGIIDEGNGHYHLVKGQVSKKSDIETNVSDKTIEETEIISNRVEINILLPNGEFKTLT